MLGDSPPTMMSLPPLTLRANAVEASEATLVELTMLFIRLSSTMASPTEAACLRLVILLLLRLSLETKATAESLTRIRTDDAMDARS